MAWSVQPEKKIDNARKMYYSSQKVQTKTGSQKIQEIFYYIQWIKVLKNIFRSISEFMSPSINIIILIFT